MSRSPFVHRLLNAGTTCRDTGPFDRMDGGENDHTHGMSPYRRKFADEGDRSAKMRRRPSVRGRAVWLPSRLQLYFLNNRSIGGC